MTSTNYERYGLTGNPFRDLASENLGDVEFFHVNLAIDSSLRQIKEEAFDKENRAMVALVGGPGVGKTQRLLLAHAEALHRKAFSVYFDVPSKTSTVIQGVARAFLAASKSAGRSGFFSAPKWTRGISQLAGMKGEQFDPVLAGRALAEALNSNAPSFLLLNDLHNLAATGQADLMARVLQETSDMMKPGAVVMFGCYPTYLLGLTKARPAFASRLNRTFTIPELSEEEADLLLAKKLLAKRLVEDLDPLYPFDREAVAILNQAAAGNPRRLLEQADLALEQAAESRAYRIDGDLVRAALASRKPAEPIARPPPTAPPPATGSVPTTRPPLSTAPSPAAMTARLPPARRPDQAPPS